MLTADDLRADPEALRLLVEAIREALRAND